MNWQGSLTLQPGIYYLDGGGLSLTGQASITGSGVMIYNAPGAAGGSINLTGGGDVTPSPPTSGPYHGIGFFQDRASSVPVKLTVKGTISIEGTFYAAAAPIKMTGAVM